MIIDLADIQWWQGVVAILGALGLSPAPWILGLALGRLQFSGPAEAQHARELANLKDSHARETAEIVAHHAAQLEAARELTARADATAATKEDARKVEADRATKATEQLAEVAIEAAKIANVTLTAIDDSAKGKP